MRPPPRLIAPTPGNVLPARAKSKVVGELEFIALRKARNAASFHRHRFVHFHYKETGQVCSCVRNSVPDGNCPLCLGTGFVGGYEQIGISEQILDPRFAFWTNLVLDQDSRPWTWFNDSSFEGVLRWDTFLPLSSKQQFVFYGTGKWKLYFLRGNDWIEWSEGMTLQGNTSLKLVLSPSSSFQGIIVKYLNIHTNQIPFLDVNISKPGQTPSMSELGWYVAQDEINIWVDGTQLQLDKISELDWFYDLETGLRWKITRIEPVVWEKNTTSLDIRARLVQPFESFASFPILV